MRPLPPRTVQRACKADCLHSLPSRYTAERKSDAMSKVQARVSAKRVDDFMRGEQCSDSQSKGLLASRCMRRELLSSTVVYKGSLCNCERYRLR